jgi:predicted RNase H-like HicB family nuclease
VKAESYLAGMKPNWIERDGEAIDLPNFSAVIEKEGNWFVSRCPEIGLASQGKTRTEAYRMLSEAVELWLEHASAAEIRRRLRRGARVRPLQLSHA